MPKTQVHTTNVTAGEFSPKLRGRTDLEKYNASAELAENCVILRHGGVTMRPSRDYKGEIKTSSQTARLIPFVYSRTDAYELELGNLYMRVWKAGVQVESSPGVPYEITTPWTDAQLAALTFCQAGDTLILTHQSVTPQRIVRFADAVWVCESLPFDTPVVADIGVRHSTAMTIGSGALGAQTITGTGFDVALLLGRQISWSTGLATIDAVPLSTQLTVTVTRVFVDLSADANEAIIDGSPYAELTFVTAGIIGEGQAQTCRITSSNFITAGAAVGSIIEANGGMLRIEQLTIAPVGDAVCTIVKAIASTTAVPAGGWNLLMPVFNSIDGYPGACTFYQQRLWFAGSPRFPQSEWGSRSGLAFDFLPGTDDSAAVYKTLDSDETNLVQHLTNAGGLLLALTYGGEFDTRGGLEQAVTQLNAQITQRSRWGCDTARPVLAGQNMLFVTRGGQAVRELVRGQTDDTGFATNEISVFSEHLLRAGVKCMAWEQVPHHVCWIATNEGKLLTLTYSAEHAIAALCSGSSDGFVEWLITKPEGTVDATYALVRYTINGVTKRYLERLNWDVNPGQDSRKAVTLGAASATFTGYGHLALEEVSLLADGVYVGTATVTAGGEITLPRTALTLSAGLPYTATLTLPAPEVGTGTGTAQGQAMSVNKIWIRFLETVGCTVNDQVLQFRQLDQNILDMTVPPYTGLKDVSDIGWGAGEMPMTLQQSQPYPWTILSVVRSYTVNAG
jgi:hypothetical protein